MSEELLRHSTIYHPIRRKYKISLLEYCLADSIYHLSNDPSGKVQGWCYASKKKLADNFDISETYIFSNINNLIEKGLIERDEETKYLRTTKKWYEEVILCRELYDGKQNKDIVNFSNTHGKQNKAPDGKQNQYNNSILNNCINNKLNNIAETSSAGKEISELIFLFKSVNPLYEKLFSNTTERKAISHLLSKLGREKLEGAIRILEKTNREEFAPTITKPTELERKLANLISFVQKKQLKPSKIAIL